MVPKPRHRVRAARQPCGKAVDPRAEQLAERPRDPMPEADASTLARVVEEAGEVRVGLVHARILQRGDHVEAVPAIRGGHRVEESQLGRRQPLGQRRSLHG